MKYSPDSYRQMFDQLLSEELMFCSTMADAQQIYMAMKKVLGSAIRVGIIKGYRNLAVQANFDVTFVIIDPDNEYIGLTLYYAE